MKFSAQYHVFPATFHVISRKIDFLWDSLAGRRWGRGQRVGTCLDHYIVHSRSEGGPGSEGGDRPKLFRIPIVRQFLHIHFTVYMYSISFTKSMYFSTHLLYVSFPISVYIFISNIYMFIKHCLESSSSNISIIAYFSIYVCIYLYITHCLLSIQI